MRDHQDKDPKTVRFKHKSRDQRQNRKTEIRIVDEGGESPKENSTGLAKKGFTTTKAREKPGPTVRPS